jgi:formylglycine-generating enzyme required for sulfatase activity
MKIKYFIPSLITLALFFSLQINAQKTTDLDMIKVDGGKFLMGSKDGDRVADADEQKQHEVYVNGFEISKFEVSVWQWKAFIKDTKGKMPEVPAWGWKDNFPVNQISWADAISYCNWLSKKEKLQPAYTLNGPNTICNFKANGYRLPTEAEWEYAAKGGKLSKGTKYSGSDNANQIAWHKANSNKTPHTIGTKSPNELGIYDMSGNVWEWCWDWYNEDYYKTAVKNNPTGPEMGEKRTVKGGSWDSKTDYLRPANRVSTYPDKTHPFYGFRIAKSIAQ